MIETNSEIEAKKMELDEEMESDDSAIEEEDDVVEIARALASNTLKERNQGTKGKNLNSRFLLAFQVLKFWFLRTKKFQRKLVPQKLYLVFIPKIIQCKKNQKSFPLQSIQKARDIFAWNWGIRFGSRNDTQSVERIILYAVAFGWILGARTIM